MESKQNKPHNYLAFLFIPLSFVLVLLLIQYGIVKAPDLIQAHADNKLLPIYCVDRSADSGAPKVALSFDAVWGDGG